MRVTRDQNGTTFQRDSFSELFVFKMHDMYMDKSWNIPKGYTPLYMDDFEDVWNVWRNWLIPFVKFFRFLNYKWWRAYVYCRRRNWLKTVEGQKKSWFWPAYFIKRNKN